MRAKLHPEARAEIDRDARWYDSRRGGLGDEFVDEVFATIDRTVEVPELYPGWPSARKVVPLIRKARVERFPYSIAFQRREQSLFVLAVAHAKRRPMYWLSRAKL